MTKKKIDTSPTWLNYAGLRTSRQHAIPHGNSPASSETVNAARIN
jgi:hypothetical protein